MLKKNNREESEEKQVHFKDIREYMTCIYYYVPPCPVCGSKYTGYYKRMTDDSGWTSKEGLKHGEIVRETTEVTDNNAFCE